MHQDRTYNNKTKFIVITGGVLSGLGKGVASASLGYLLSSQYKVVPLKLDGYLNVDPGTMNPIEHGEVFVLDDGGEVDMDFGHYERFLGVQCKSSWNLTMGKVFEEIRKKERRGDYLGKTVQYTPHVSQYIKEKFYQIANDENADFLLIEVGGTVGDMENELYLEACRQLLGDVGKENILYVHLTYVPLLYGVDEQKSKPTQQSVNLLRRRGINPNMIIGRCSEILTEKTKEKIATFANLSKDAVITGLDVDNIYDIPLTFLKEGVLDILNKNFKLNLSPQHKWKSLLERKPYRNITVALCGKYTSLEDSYASVVEAIRHASLHHGCTPTIRWIDTEKFEQGDIQKNVVRALEDVDGIVIPGGFGARGAEGKIAAIKYCREQKVPFLGLCYGMQLAVVEYARHVLNLQRAHSAEIDPRATHKVVDLLPEQQNLLEKGATMRLGGHDIYIKEGTNAYKLFGSLTRMRFRHRYEINPTYVHQLTKAGLVFSGTSSTQQIMQLLELPQSVHPFFIATQAHPELTSKLEHPHKLFSAFVHSCGDRRQGPVEENYIKRVST